MLESFNYSLIHSISDNRLQVVADIVDNDKRSWKYDVITNTFHLEDAEQIVRLPLMRFPHEDELASSR